MCCDDQAEMQARVGGLHGVAHLEAIQAIAISGRSGCGNTTVNKLVAESLGLVSVNYTMRNYAAEQGLSLEEVAQRAQLDSQLDRLIDRRQVEMCLLRATVLSSRLAIWLLPRAVLRVYLQASAAGRARRIQQREGGSYAQRLAETEERDRRDAQRYCKLYQLDTADFLFADLIVNTESFDQYRTAELIVQAYRQRTD